MLHARHLKGKQSSSSFRVRILSESVVRPACICSDTGQRSLTHCLTLWLQAVNQLQSLQRPLQLDHGAVSSGPSDEAPEEPAGQSWWPAWEAHIQSMSEGLSKYNSSASTSRMMRVGLLSFHASAHCIVSSEPDVNVSGKAAACTGLFRPRWQFCCSPLARHLCF